MDEAGLTFDTIHRTHVHAVLTAGTGVGIDVDAHEGGTDVVSALLALGVVLILVHEQLHGGEGELAAGLAHGAGAGEGHGLADLAHHIGELALALALGDLLDHGLQLDQTLAAEGALAAALLTALHEDLLGLVDDTAGGGVDGDDAAADVGVGLDGHVHGVGLVQLAAQSEGVDGALTDDVGHGGAVGDLLQLAHLAVLLNGHISAGLVGAVDGLSQSQQSFEVMDGAAAVLADVDDAVLHVDAVLGAQAGQLLAQSLLALGQDQDLFLGIHGHGHVAQAFQDLAGILTQQSQQGVVGVGVVQSGHGADGGVLELALLGDLDPHVHEGLVVHAELTQLGSLDENVGFVQSSHFAQPSLFSNSVHRRGRWMFRRRSHCRQRFASQEA